MKISNRAVFWITPWKIGNNYLKCCSITVLNACIAHFNISYHNLCEVPRWNLLYGRPKMVDLSKVKWENVLWKNPNDKNGDHSDSSDLLSEATLVRKKMSSKSYQF